MTAGSLKIDMRLAFLGKWVGSKKIGAVICAANDDLI
jgi:hypothetical protein